MGQSIIPQGIEVISFDLDDTLWSGPQIIRHAEQASQNWMREHTPEVFSHFNADQLLEKRIQFLKQNPQLKNQISQSRQLFLQQLFKELELPNPQSKAKACFDVFYQARQNVTLFDGVLETLYELKKQYRLISITNGNADVQQTELADMFELSLIAEDFQRPKPHGDMFEHATASLTCEPQAILHVGDHPVHDMQGAYEMGMYTCWLDDGSRQWNQTFEPDIVVKAIQELTNN